MDDMEPSGISPADQISDLRKQQDLPFVRADSEGIVREINSSFRTVGRTRISSASLLA